MGSKICLFSIYFVKYLISIPGYPSHEMLYGRIRVTIVYSFELKKFDFRGWWSATPKYRGWSKKSYGPTTLKNRGGSLAVGSYFQRGSTPPPQHHPPDHLNTCPPGPEDK